MIELILFQVNVEAPPVADKVIALPLHTSVLFAAALILVLENNKEASIAK